MDNFTTSPVHHLLLSQEEKSTNHLLTMLKVINRFNVKYILPVIVMSGIIGNLLALAVFICSPLRRLTISVYLAALSLTDIIFLIFLGLGWLGSLEINIFHLEGLCQTMVYLTFVVSFLSLWFIVIFTSELYFSIYCTTLHRLISRPKRAISITVVFTILACSIYMFSFWLTRNVKNSETKRSCGFIGSRSAAIAVPIMDSVLTLVVPFSLLIFMYVRIVYTLTSLSNTKFKGAADYDLKQEPEVTTRSDNLLAKAIRMGTRIRRRLRYHGPRNKSETNSALVENNSHHIRLETVKKISLSLSHGEITINNSAGELLSIAKLIVKNDNLGITVSRRRSSEMSGAANENEKFGEGRRFSCTEANIVIKAKIVSRRKSEAMSRIQGESTEAGGGSDGDNDYNKILRKSSITRSNAEKFKEKVATNQFEPMEEEEFKVEEDETASVLLSKDADGYADKKYADDITGREEMKRLMSMQKLKKRSLKMIISIAVIFVVLNLPSHAIRLQSMLRSLFDPSYQTSELELHLQQFFQTVYYFNFIANFITYSAFAKSFRTAFLHLPWHVVNTFSQLFCSLCGKKEQVSYWSRQRQIREINEHSRLVEICIPELHLSQITSFGPDFKYVSPPCLLKLE